MSKNRRLLILYDWFYPGFRAGGPIQSLSNLALSLQKHFEIFVLTTAFDLHSTVAYDGITIDSWNKVELQPGSGTINVFYAGNKSLTKKHFAGIIEEVQPHTIYFNGIFSYRFFLLPLLSLRSISAGVKIVVCPRGMLKKGALSGKSFKKKLYLSFVRISGLLTRAHWHATSAEEASDITLHFPRNKGIVTASNIPKLPLAQVAPIVKTAGVLKLVSLSLINEHKNILLLLQLLIEFAGNIELDIYGPIIDNMYWKKCEVLIGQLQGRVTYKGEVQPGEVQQMLSQYHALILLTKGENFGHAIYESFSVGRPVITSHFTPWNDLQEKNGGANVDIHNIENCLQGLHKLYEMEQQTFNAYCAGAHHVAVEYFQNLNAADAYNQLFL